MPQQILTKPAVIQRRSSITDLQAVLDGLLVVGLCYLLITHHIGVLTAHYTVFVFLLLCTLGLVYNAFGIYRKNMSFTRKALDLFQAWTLTFFILIALGFLTKQSETFSRLLLGQLFVIGYVLQAGLHFLVRISFKEMLRHSAELDRVIIVGTGRVAAFLDQRIQRSEWLGQTVIGLVSLPPAEGGPEPDQETFGPTSPILGRLDELVELIDRHQVRTVYFAIPLNASNIIESLYFRLLDKHVAVHWVPDIFSLPLVNHTVSS
ncbi:MAG: undecaprenyl-phosphate glucose phosphotransferase, partial [Ramlibacter sp.]|nr:undecaprenyl-phosphate glucose phosphotransferase [Ramlibacter sp.]